MIRLRWIQDAAGQAGEHGAEAVQAVEHAADAAEHSEVFDLGATLGHHILNSSEWELPFFTWDLPHFEPIHLGPVTLDLSFSKHLMLLFLAAALTLVMVTWVARTVSKKIDDAPTGFANAVEAIVMFFRDDVCKVNIGHGYERFTPFVLTLFFFILNMNLLGLVPWGGSATGNLSVTAALAIITFLVVEVGGLLKLGPIGYAKTIFFVPPGTTGITAVIMLLIMTPVEFLSKLTKPFALAIRLFANMTAGHMLIFTLLGLIFVFSNTGAVQVGVAFGSFLMVSAIMLLELLVALIQAYIFAMLAAVFIGLMQHEH